ncbi:MAG: TlpA family protein disulfide reductase [Planctomycetes bacterium]|nr:TlpA family protein disulfide reductase [Planctomycetota bacterium]
MSDPPPARRRLASRTLALVLLLTAGAWFAATSGVRWWVDRELDAAHGRVLDRELRDTSDRVWTREELRGKTVVLAFFRSFCEGCLAERDAIRELAVALEPKRALLFSVMMDGVEDYSPDETAKTLVRMDYHHPVVMADAALLDAFHGTTWAHVTPVTWVIDGEGRVVTHLRGHHSLSELLAATPPDARRKP